MKNKNNRLDYIAIANIGHGRQGKTTTIRRVYDILTAKYPNSIVDSKIGKEVKAILSIHDVLIGIESMGDPGSRQYKSLNAFREKGCKIILCACRSRGETKQNVQNLSNKGNYNIIWASNIRPDENLKSFQNYWNEIYAQNMVQFIEKYVLGKL